MSPFEYSKRLFLLNLLSLSFRDNQRYEAVDSGESEAKSWISRAGTGGGWGLSSKRALLVYLSSISLVVVVGQLIYHSGIAYGKSHLHIAKYSCGSNPTEARENGCFFDPMMSAWTPSQCYFPNLVEEYGDIFSKWNWFWDNNHTMPITSPSDLETIRAGNYSSIYTDHSHAHDLHCVYTWRKMSQTLENNLFRLDARSLDFHHSTHCAMWISDILEGNDPMAGSLYVTIWPMMYHECLPIETQFK